MLGVVGCSGELREFPWAPFGHRICREGDRSRDLGAVSEPNPCPQGPSRGSAASWVTFPESTRLEKPSRARRKERPFPVIPSAGFFGKRRDKNNPATPEVKSWDSPYSPENCVGMPGVLSRDRERFPWERIRNSLDSPDPALPVPLQREGESLRPKLVLLVGVTGAGWTLGAAPAAFQRPMEFPRGGRDGQSRSMSPPRLQECRYSLFSVCRHLPFQQNRGKSHVFNTKKPVRLSLGKLPRCVPQFQGSGMSEQGKRDHSPRCPHPQPRPSKAFSGEFYPKSFIPARSKLPPAGNRVDTPESSLGFLLQEGIPSVLNLSSSSSLIFLLQI